MSWLHTIIIAIIEGITEFLPISSTGHMILAGDLLHIPDSEFYKTFEISIQLGAILAIILLYFRRFIKDLTIYWKLAIAFIPTGIIGLLAYKYIKAYLFNPYVVSGSLIIGGVVLILLDRMIEGQDKRVSDLDQIPYKNAFMIGLFQCLAMIPGVSRSAATIVGGVFNRFDKKQATEFSFLLAVPTMVAATGYDLLKTSASINGHQLTLILFGGLIALVTAIFAVKFFVSIVERYGFRYFGYYRIVIGILFLVLKLTVFA